MDTHIEKILSGEVLNVQFNRVNRLSDMKGVEAGTPMVVQKRNRFIHCTLIKTSYLTKRIKVMVVRNCFDRTDVESYYILEDDLKKGGVYVCA